MIRKELAFYRGFFASNPSVPHSMLSVIADFVVSNKDKPEFSLIGAESIYSYSWHKLGAGAVELIRQGFIEPTDLAKSLCRWSRDDEWKELKIVWTEKAKTLFEMTEYTIRLGGNK